jgi:hypothetical protein
MSIKLIKNRVCLAELAEKASRKVVHLDFAFDNLKIIMDQQRDFVFAALT